ncbi:MAG: galactosamine-6-phosphate isomerase [Bacteroidota bacterium]|nr:galactosamine-6-phosphate isomerase [Bacteroidota bacterium]MDP4214258.1 galactosamine-6-phosphate isomerase [Bacteroidota bacterium]MDP4252214.1 galactosamine-6-phosphate isomerase [Bacteroidota bacterium]
MKIHVLESYEELSERAAEVLIGELERKKNLLLCAATGNTPGGVYSAFVKEHRQSPGLFSDVNIIKLDEWGGIPMDDPGTCESYLQTQLIKPLHVESSRYISFNSNPEDPQAECKRIGGQLDKFGGIDVCIVGLGMNGHIALNEPADFLEPDIHIARLSATSLTHSMVSEMDKKPGFGLTLGMKAILESRLILMLVNGKKKKEMARSFLSRKVTTQLPASFLWLHPNAICFIDREAY